MSSSVFSKTLQSITTTKLNELSKKRKIFEDQKVPLLLSAKNETHQHQELRILVDGVKNCFSMRKVTRRGDRCTALGRFTSDSTNDPQLEILLKNLELFLEQAKYDPSVSSKLLSDWERSLIQKLKVQSLKYEYATLYGELVNEWLTAESPVEPADDMSVSSDEFEKTERTTKDESRGGWERLVFEPLETDQMAISDYLRSLFGQNGGNTQGFKALEALRKNVRVFQLSLCSPGQFNDHVLRWTINGLLASGLLSEEKRAVLKDFLASSVILAEVADVLNMRLSAISAWSWEQEVPIEQRRHVTGVYHSKSSPFKISRCHNLSMRVDTIGCSIH